MCRIFWSGIISHTCFLNMCYGMFQDKGPNQLIWISYAYDNIANFDQVQHNMTPFHDSMRECHDNMPACYDNMRECHDNMPACYDNMRECHDNMPAS